MPNCPKCGSKVDEEMSFCPKCGAPLKAAQPSAETRPAPAPIRGEKAEKHEKREKGEKTERHEKREFGFIFPFLGGIILILLGLVSYLRVTGFFGREIEGAIVLIVIGVVIIIGTLYALMVAARRHPKP
jgi:hypothetical protein